MRYDNQVVTATALTLGEMEKVSMTLSDVMKLLQIDKFPDLPLTESEERFLVEATERLVKENGEDWVRRHRKLLLDQWEYIRWL